MELHFKILGRKLKKKNKKLMPFNYENYFHTLKKQ